MVALTNKEREQFTTWGILELLGHRRVGGYISVEQIASRDFLRVDIAQDNGVVTEYYNPDSVYALTPVNEEAAKAVGADGRMPVHPWEIKPDTQTVMMNNAAHSPSFTYESPDYLQADEDDDMAF